MALVWLLLGEVITMAVAMPLEGVYTSGAAFDKVWELLLDPSSASRLTFVVQEVIWAILGWILELALLVLYLEREDQVRAKAALKKLEQQPGPG